MIKTKKRLRKLIPSITRVDKNKYDYKIIIAESNKIVFNCPYYQTESLVVRVFYLAVKAESSKRKTLNIKTSLKENNVWKIKERQESE